MAQEVKVNSYYQSLRNNNFIDTNLMCKFGMEFYLSQLLFNGDLNRVVYSKEDIAFRRRVETVGQGDIKNQDYNYINLGLPFAAYSQTGTYEADDRGATQQAGQIVLGQMNPDTGLILKAAAVKIKYNATVFFARRDDVNIASQLLYWESQPKFPLYFIVEHDLCGHPIDIPVFITLDSFDSNVEYNEKDWLEKSKIFPIKCEFTIRSYQTLIEQIDDGLELPVRFSGLYGYNKNNEVVFTHKTSLIWGDNKFGPNPIFSGYNFNPPDGEGAEIHLPQNITQKPQVRAPIQINGEEIIISEHLKNDGRFTKDVIEETISDVVEGYFEEEPDCILEEYRQIDELTTDNTITIGWKVLQQYENNFESIVIYVPGIVRDKISSLDTNQFEIKDLYPGSTYECALSVTSKNFVKNTYKLIIKTTGEPVLGKTLMSNLVGKTFSNQILNNYGRSE